MPEYIILNCEHCKKPVMKMHRCLLSKIREAMHYSGDHSPHFYHIGCPGGFERADVQECIRLKGRSGSATHYCIGATPGIDCPPPGHGCAFSQFKPVYHRMMNKKAKLEAEQRSEGEH